jgi:hypothetical protein
VKLVVLTIAILAGLLANSASADAAAGIGFSPCEYDAYTTAYVCGYGSDFARPLLPTASFYAYDTASNHGDPAADGGRSLRAVLGPGGQRVAPSGARVPMRLWDDAPFDGFLFNYRRAEILSPGTRIDRFGPETGRFFSPERTPLPNRALPNASGSPTVYEVLKPLDVQAGVVAPAFGQPGLGIQYMTSSPVADLIRLGYLKPVP